MSAFKYLMGIWTAIAVYAVVSLLNGPSGLAAYRQLEAERDRQLANMRALNARTGELENTHNSLLYDHETIAVYARRLGYARENERFVRIVGLGWTQNPYTAPGRVYFAGTPEYVSDTSVKIAALCAGLAAFIFFFALELLRNRELTDSPPNPADP